jgi:hypothetical protein
MKIRVEGCSDRQRLHEAVDFVMDAFEAFGIEESNAVTLYLKPIHPLGGEATILDAEGTEIAIITIKDPSRKPLQTSLRTTKTRKGDVLQLPTGQAPRLVIDNEAN